MPSTYSTNLKIELQATGENSGTWGTITNTNLGTALEQAIVGYGNPNYASDANLTLTYTDTNAAQAARALVLNVTSGVSLTQTRELVVPTIQKQYIVQNNTTGAQSITVKTSGGSGITVPNGRKAHLYVNGTDVIQMFDFVDINGGSVDGATVGAASASTGAFTTLSASSTTTLSALTASTALALNASKEVVSVTNSGSGNNVLATGASLTTPQFTSYRETVVVNSNATGTVTLDLSQGNVFNLTLTGATTLAFSNPPSSGISFSFTVICLQGSGGSKTLAYPASVKFTDSVTPVITTTAGKYDVLTFFTVDGGTTYFGAYAMANL